jgi:hypothetical protein
MRIDIECLRYGQRSEIYRVMHADEVLLAATRNPEFDTARSSR